MDATAPRVREASLAHRLFGLAPGRAPDWAYAFCGGCDGSPATIASAGLLVAGAAAGEAWGWWALAAVAAVAVGGLVVLGRFADRERFGRARLHRGECVWCGQPAVAPSSVCPACGRSAEPAAAPDRRGISGSRDV